MSELIDSRLSLTITTAVLVGLASVVGTFFLRLYRARMLLIERRRRGLPVAPGHSFLFGHLLYLKSVLDRLPKDAHYQYGFATIAREQFYETGAFYMDLWPMSGLFLTVVSPKIGIEITQENPQLTSERPPLLRRFLKPITGGLNIFDMSEKEWKPWRAAFNKGFHGDRIMGLVPGIIRETQVYAETLRGLAEKGRMCYLGTVTLRFTIDMIGQTILWHNPNAEVNPFSHLDFVRAFIHWKNGRQMDRYIGTELDKRYEEYLAEPDNADSKSVIDLVLRSHMSRPGKSSSPSAKLDPEFRAFAIRQIRLFVFAGYDSTGSVIRYCFHLLSQHPEVRARLCEEHDQVFGPDPTAAYSMLSEQPRLVNNLTYTLAVIKETMRLFAPAGTTRAGKPGVNITDDAGNSCPTDDAILWILHVEMHRSSKYWVQPDAFLPERWLVPPGHELHPQPGAWRPFEHGPRNCIAQALALVELRVILACLARSFEMQPAYDEWDAGHPVKGTRTYRGERAYQVEEGAAHPAAHYPCYVKSVDTKA